MGQAKMTIAVGIVLAIINMRIIRSRYGFGLADTDIPEVPVAKPSRRKYTSRYKRRSKPRTTNAPPAKRGDHTAVTNSARHLAPPAMPRSHRSGAFRMLGAGPNASQGTDPGVSEADRAQIRIKWALGTPSTEFHKLDAGCCTNNPGRLICVTRIP